MPSAESLEESPKSERAADKAAARLEKMKVAEADEASIWMIVLRDVAIVAALLTLFGAADTWARISYLGVAKFVSVVVGLLVGAALPALGHEWGHFIGARLGGGHAPLKPLQAFPQLYDFDYKRNDSKSFRWMSYGGSLGNWGTVLLLAWLIPLVEAGPVALVSGGIGFCVFTALVEWPVIQRSKEGLGGWDALMTIPSDFQTRYLPWALGATFGVFFVL